MLSRLLFAAVALLGLAVLVALGLWQLARAAEKDATIAAMEARLSDDPVPLPEAPTPEADAFRAVALTGRVAGEGVAVFSTWRGAGGGYRIVAPFETDDGRRVLLDRGHVPRADLAAVPEGRIAVEGHLHWPREREGDPSDGYEARDVPVIAAALGTEPVLVVARAVSETGGVRPVPLDTEGISDNHLGYAIQWFGLAAVWAGMSAFYFTRRRT